jgi:hypothetical protein
MPQKIYSHNIIVVRCQESAQRMFVLLLDDAPFNSVWLNTVHA